MDLAKKNRKHSGKNWKYKWLVKKITKKKEKLEKCSKYNKKKKKERKVATNYRTFARR